MSAAAVSGRLLSMDVGTGVGADGGLVVRRQVLRVEGDGPSLIQEVVDLLALDDDTADAVLLREGDGQDDEATVIDDPPAVVKIMGSDRSGQVLVREPWSDLDRTHARELLPDGLLSAMTRSRLDAGEAMPHLHGAALTDAIGRAVVVVGRSGAGKSTMTAWLAAAGLDLVNDEQIALFPASTRIGGFARPVSVKPGSVPHLPAGVAPAGAEVGAARMLVTAADLGSRHRLTGRPVLVVVPERDDAHGLPVWDVVPPADAVRELCTHNLDLVRDPVAALESFAWLATTAPMVRLRYRDAADVVPVLLDLLADPPGVAATSPRVEVEPPAGVVSEGLATEGPAPAVARSPGAVTAWVGEDAVLYEPRGRGVAVLNADAADVWASLPWPDLTAGESASVVVPQLVAELAHRGLVGLGGPLASVFRRRPGLVSRVLRGTEIVARSDLRIARLEGEAARVWEVLDEPGRADEVADRLLAGAAARSSPSRWEDIAGTVEEALDRLIATDLVIIDPPAPRAPAASTEAGSDGPVDGADEVGGRSDGRSAAGGTTAGSASRSAASVAAGEPAEVEAVLAGVAGWLLPGAPPVPALRDASDADVLVDRASALRLLGPLVVAVDAGALDLPEDAIERAVAGHEESLLWCLHLEVRLLEIREWFADAGVPFLLTKGAAVAHLDDLDPSLRSFVDLDLLVPGPDMDRAVEALEAHGGRRAYVQRRPGFDRRFVKSVTVKLPDDVEVDVHRTLCDGTHGFRIPLDRLHSDAATFRLGGEDIRTLSRVHRALHAAYHGVLGSAVPPMRSVRDFGAYLASPDLPPEVLAAEASTWRGEAVLAVAVRAVFDTFALDAPEWRRWLDEVEVDPREEAIVARQRVESGSYGRAALAALRELGWKDRLEYGTAVALPTGEHLRSRGARRIDVVGNAVRRGADLARSRRRRP